MNLPARRGRAAIVLLGALLTLALVGMAGCATDRAGAEGDAVARTAADPDSFPVTIEHAFGSTTIEAEPTRVATLGWSDQDHALALGVVPVGATKLTWGGNARGSSDWFDDALTALAPDAAAPVRYDDADGAPVEEIAQLAPDLILATNSGITKAEYAKLSRIAPVVAYPEAPWVTPWQQSLTLVGKALGRSALATDVAAKTEKAIAAGRAAHPQVVGKSLIFGYLSTADLSQIGIYAPQDPRVSLLHDLGLVDAAAVADAVDPGQFYASVSAERAADLASDVFLTWAESKADVATFTSDRLIGTVPAIAAGHVYAEARKPIALAVTNPTPLSIPVVLDQSLPAVAQAVDGS